MCDFCHAQLFEITHVSNIKSTPVQHSCRNAEVVEAFCRVDASRSDTRRSIHWPSIAALHTPAERPTALSFPRHADIERRLVLASRLPSRASPALNLIAPAAEPVPNFPRLRALALFGRRSVEPAEPPCCRRPKTSTTGDQSRCSNVREQSYDLIDHLIGASEQARSHVEAK